MSLPLPGGLASTETRLPTLVSTGSSCPGFGVVRGTMAAQAPPTTTTPLFRRSIILNNLKENMCKLDTYPELHSSKIRFSKKK